MAAQDQAKPTMKEHRQALKAAYDEMRKDEPDHRKVETLLRDQAEEGNPIAKYGLGSWYLHGYHHFEKDVAKGIKLIEEAAEERVPEACYDLAYGFESGKGGEQNPKMAFKYYVLAALYGDSDSFVHVGRCYHDGIGVEKDEELADCWWEKAEALGVKHAHTDE